MEKISWDCYFMSMAYMVAMKSKDNSTKIGSVIVGKDHEILSTGYNGLPRGMDDSNPEYQIKPDKYAFFEHSERNSVFAAARNGVHLLDTTLYTQGIPCSDCARAIIQAGIKRVVVHEQWNRSNAEKWAKSAEYSVRMFKSCGVKLEYYSGDLIIKIVGLHDGKIINLEEYNGN
jgi:dCMP deaminase